MKPPSAYREARRNAPVHAQLLRVHCDPQPEYDSSVRVVGRIVRIFRDDTKRFWRGQRIAFFVPVVGMARQDSPIVGGTIYLSWNRLLASRWFEAFLCPRGEGVELVESQLAPIRHPTLWPVCNPNADGFVCEGNVG